jgi:hypothetical protein
MHSVFKESLLTEGGIAVVSAAALFGPGRAAWIAIRSRFAFKPVPESLRVAEIQMLRRRILDKNIGQGFFVVIGENGVGKTCLMNAVTRKIPGVINVKASPLDNENEVINSALRELTGFKFQNAKAVVFWHIIFTFGQSPIVVIDTDDNSTALRRYVGLTGAVRILAEKFKLRVVIIGSPDSLDESLFQTTREQVIDIQSMTKEMIWKMEQLQNLFRYSKEAGLDDCLFAVLGGIPSRFEALWIHTKIDLLDGQDPRQVIGSYLCAQISAAIKLIDNSCGKKNSDMEEIIKLLDKQTNSVRCKLLALNNLERPDSDKIFRKAERDGVVFLVPASNAIGIVLKHGLFKKPSLDELEKLIKIQS